MDQILDACRIPNWYPRLSVYSLPATFVWLQPSETAMLAAGEKSTAETKAVVQRLEKAMANFLYTRFVSVDLAAPVDTERFASKRGAVRSARSAWNVLASSTKIRNSAARGEVSCICVHPFRRMDPAREFRLFIKGGKLKAVSQYWLVQHFPKLEKSKDKYWKLCQDFVNKCFAALPLPDIVIDVYFTSDDIPLVIDLNPFSAPTDPLMLNSWNIDWSIPQGMRIVPSPHMVSGDINVSF